MNPYQISLPVTTITSLGLGAFVLYKNPRSSINVMWSFTCLSVAIWSTGFWLGAFAEHKSDGLLWWNIGHYAALLIPILLAHFVNALVGTDIRKNWVVRSGYVLAILFLPCAILLKLPHSVEPKVMFDFFPNPSPLYSALLIVFSCYTIYSHAVLVKGLGVRSQVKANQIKLTLLATSLGFASGTPAFLVAYNVRFDPWPVHFVFIYAVVITYAIVKHQLMDITVVLRKSVIYSILVALLTATYLTFVVATEKLLQGVMGYQTWAPSLLAAFVIALGFTPVRNWVQSFVDRYFFKGTQAMIAAENVKLRHEVERSERLKSVSLLATGLAHEIKNPLAAIRTFVEYLPERYQDEAFRERFIRIVGSEVDRINVIVQQLLSFAKPAPLALQPTDVNRVLQDTLSFLSNETVKRHIHVTTELRANHAPIQADANQLRQVVLNLLLNSLEAMKDNGQLHVASADTPHGVEILVRDAGCGMSREVAQRIFEPFFTTKSTGVGLGLAVVKDIIERHGGTITCASTPGQGTTFTLRLPRISTG